MHTSLSAPQAAAGGPSDQPLDYCCLMSRALSVLLLLFVAACNNQPDAAPPATAGAPSATPPAASSAASSADRKYLLERVDDAAVAQLYADGFPSLPLKEKTLIWHLYQAAIAGRDIFYDQKHRDALEMRRILEQIIAHP